MKVRFAWLGLFGLLAVGCQGAHGVSGLLDSLSFSQFGWTIFANPQPLGLKEVHLGEHLQAGGEVIVEGMVTNLSEHGTYLVLNDDSARLLVVLAEVDGDVPLAQVQGAKAVRVLGSIESGKKGLPYLKARAVKLISESALRENLNRETPGGKV